MVEQRGAVAPAQRRGRVCVLTLNHDQHLNSALYRLEKGNYLRLSPGPSILGKTVTLYCNYASQDTDFVRTKYRTIPWSQENNSENTQLGNSVLVQDTDIFCEIYLERAGSFHFYFLYEGNTSTRQGSGYFHVAPTLRFGADDEELPLDCIQCQTVLAKSLGPLNTWEAKLRVGKESGYNMIHFTPIQELGDSNSSYSLANQLAVNPIFSAGLEKPVTFDDIDKLVKKMRREWKMGSICDIVLNHTANESCWLLEHPEATYNAQNCPHLRPAVLLDIILAKLTDDVGKGCYEHRGIPRVVDHPHHLDAIKHVLLSDLIPSARIEELYCCDVADIIQQFCHLARNKVPEEKSELDKSAQELKVIQDPQHRRLKSTVNLDLALQLYNVYRSDCYDEDTRVKKCSEELKSKLEELNWSIRSEVYTHLTAAVDNCIAGMRYFRCQDDGPKIKEVSEKDPLVPRYFTHPTAITTLSALESTVYGEEGRYVMAHNGWVMNGDPLQDFASYSGGTANVYLRRELIAWGDSVKLRYGEKPEDAPFLWEHMREYVELTARLFDGIRLDNCHSTPLHVAEYLLDCARRVRPELYVVAELFTNSDQLDNIFVNRLGITSLIREAQSAWDSHELGRLVYRYGGQPVGAFPLAPHRPRAPHVAHAIFLDLTHDNPAPIQKRCVLDLLPSAALVSMACCASGSNRGYDELVPHHIHVVDETREYAEWTDTPSGLTADNKVFVSAQSGIIAAKRALNQLHYWLGKHGYDQVYVDQMDTDVVAVTRHDPRSRQTVILVAFTAFSQPDPNFNGRYVKPLKFEGKLEEIMLEANLRYVDRRTTGTIFQNKENFTKHPSYINGLTDYEAFVCQNISLNESTVFKNTESYDGNYTILDFKDFLPGSVVAIRVSMKDHALAAFEKLHTFSDAIICNSAHLTDQLGITELLKDLSLGDLNICLYQCDEEEKDNGGTGVYDIPGYGPLVYSGIQGVVSLLRKITPNNDLGHPLCNNLREGNWLIDYMWQRLERYPNLKNLCQWYQTVLNPVKDIPRYLIPAYFDLVITGIYDILVKAAIGKMSEFIKNGSTFERNLALGSIQCGGFINSVELPPFSPNLAPPKPPQHALTLSAGLPHFSTGYMRCWGRDTFISLRGMFLLTGRYQDARYHILAFGACLRHGLIPNLLDGGKNARFNCRDAVWWWLQSIKDYCRDVPNGYQILEDTVSRIYPHDDSPALGPGEVDQPLHGVMQEALDRHFQGVVFRERNAGRAIDAHMSDRGFNNQIGVNPETGFIFGGNEANCGTWMDKMGSSDIAGNRGKPATPRDGSAIELIGLSKSVISWLASANSLGKYPYPGVKRKHKDDSITTWTFNQWAEKIQTNFERYFWVHTTPAVNDMRPDLINRRGIYKDCYGATQPWTDYQLRCNFPIAMTVAPELFNPKHAWTALDNMKAYLLGPLGIKTLDPSDWAYRGDYDNSNQSADMNVAHGFNYHQGPEWVWPIGFYLRARLAFARENDSIVNTIGEVRSVLAAHIAEIENSPWRGLPELTNSGGAYCSDSCRTQAWSMATVLEVLYELKQLNY